MLRSMRSHDGHGVLGGMRNLRHCLMMTLVMNWNILSGLVNHHSRVVAGGLLICWNGHKLLVVRINGGRLMG